MVPLLHKPFVLFELIAVQLLLPFLFSVFMVLQLTLHFGQVYLPRQGCGDCVAQLVELLIARLERCNAAVDFFYFFWLQQFVGAYAVLLRLAFALLSAENLVNLLAYVAVDGCASERLQDLRLVVDRRGEKLGKPALGQHDRTVELLGIDAQQVVNVALDFVFLVGGQPLVAGKAPRLALQVALGLVAGAMGFPRGGVDGAVVGLEGEHHLALGRVAAHQVAHVAHRQGVGGIGGEPVVVAGIAVFGIASARGLVEQGQTQAVEYRRLARACLTGDEKQVLVVEHRAVEVDGGILYRCYIVNDKGLEFHVFFSFCASWQAWLNIAISLAFILRPIFSL